MKTHWTKKELIAELEEFGDDDVILINIHDDVFYEDNYEFYIDPIDMSTNYGSGKGEHQIWLCPVQNNHEKKTIMKFLLFDWNNLSSEELSNYATEDDIPDDIFQKFAVREGHVYTDPELFESCFNSGSFNDMYSLRIIKS